MLWWTTWVLYLSLICVADPLLDIESFENAQKVSLNVCYTLLILHLFAISEFDGRFRLGESDRKHQVCNILL